MEAGNAGEKLWPKVREFCSLLKNHALPEFRRAKRGESRLPRSRGGKRRWASIVKGRAYRQ